MADADNGFKFPWQQLLGLAGLLATFLFITPPLVSSRPSPPDVYPPPDIATNEVDARLWQDPFQAVESRFGGPDLEKLAGDYKYLTISRPASELAERTESGKVIVLPVIVPGWTYPDDVEWRLTTRYAVLSALSPQYMPVKERQIEAFVTQWPPAEGGKRASFFTAPWRSFLGFDMHTGAIADLAAKITGVSKGGRVKDRSVEYGTHSVIIPYEWLDTVGDSAGGKKDSVLVVWLSDRDLGDEPGKHLANFFRDFREAIAHSQAKPDLTQNVGLRVIGPPTSDMLEKLLSDIQNSEKCDWVREFSNWDVPRSGHALIYSPWATADGPWDAAASQFNAKSGKPLKVELNIASDKQAIQALVDELKLRNADFRHDPKGLAPHIAILSEWDTLYARTFKKEFEEVCGIPHSVDNDLESGPAAIEWYTYLRGIDGKKIGESQAMSKGDRGEALSQKHGTEFLKDLLQGNNDIYADERPSGEHQLDYIDRIANDILVHDAELRASSGTGIFAIGILGSDVYDKLLVLQSLRKRFPNALFFTTDLNAAFAFKTNLPATRNLIVASAYGLSLQATLQRNVAPFRDVYQTAAYYAVLRAMAEPGDEATKRATYGAPRIFEVSRGGAIDVTLDGLLSAAPRIHPPPDSAQPSVARGFFWLVVGLAFVGLALWLFEWPQELLLQMFHMHKFRVEKSFKVKVERPQIWWEALVAWVGLLLGAALLTLACVDNAHGTGEPFSFTLGISIWPTELLRLAASVVTGFCFIHAWFAFRRDKVEMETSFDLKNPPPGPVPAVAGAAVSPKDSTREWEEFLRITTFGRRIRRAFIYSAFVIVFSYSVVALFGPPLRPYRGWRSEYADMFFLLLAGIALLLLSTWTVDATIQSTKLVESLSEPETTWPDKVTMKWRNRYKAPDLAIAHAIDIDFFARRTEAVYRVFHFPLIVFAVLVFSRLEWFAPWPWTSSMIICFAAILLLPIYCGWRLRAAAERARRHAIKKLKGIEADEYAAGRVADALETARLVENVRSNRTGAFANWYDQPMIQSLWIPFGGLGLMAAAQYLMGGTP